MGKLAIIHTTVPVEAGKAVAFEAILVTAAYQRLLAGDCEGHDRALVEALSELASRMDVVVLAQASMARVIPSLPQELQGKFLSSPRLAMERVKAALSEAQA